LIEREGDSYIETMSKPISWINKERLYDLYVNQGLNQYQIADLFGKHQTCIYRLMKRWNIPVRSEFAYKCSVCGCTYIVKGRHSSYCSDKCYYKAKYQNEKEIYREKHAVSNKALRERYRAQFFALYGPSCNCCGESKQEFLTLDHVQNDGGIHRQQSNTYGIYRTAIREYRPDLYQTLCWNCNLAKAIYGICPHVGVTQW